MKQKWKKFKSGLEGFGTVFASKMYSDFERGCAEREKLVKFRDHAKDGWVLSL